MAKTVNIYAPFSRGNKKELKEWKKEEKCHCHHHGHGCCAGGVWFAGWLFTIALLKLTFWKAVLALVIWAYYLGSYFAGIWH